MALSTSPRKTVPLATGDNWEGPSKPKPGGGITRRVFFCGVVVESEDGREFAQDVQELVASLGDPLSAFEEQDALTPSSSTEVESEQVVRTRRRAMTDSSAIQDIINELVSTERSYVKRLHILKHDYADPLRTFSRSKDTAIIPAYEAKTLFGNVDDLLPVHEAFLADLDRMMAPDGPQAVGSVGDVVLHHFKQLRGFERYKLYYSKREEAQAIFEREMAKRSSNFAAFVDRIKYSSTDTKNRIGLRELLMDPVQRIPRYTLMFRTMTKRMHPGDTQRTKLIEADEIASKIAHAEADEETKRATILNCLSSSIEGFPVNLISAKRRFIDFIDVQDTLADTSSSASSSAPLETLHCSLVLFDDKLLIIKRPGNGEKSGRALAGMDHLDRVTKGGFLPFGTRKSGMSCKGVFDISEVAATDVGGSDFHLYLEVPPEDQTERWAGRPFRALSVVFPPAPIGLNPTRTDTEKKRFLEKLWHAQAQCRTKTGNSVVLRAEEREVESRNGRVTYARTYFNLYQRTAFLRETKKTKVVVHIDPLGASDPLPFGINAAPYVVIRVQPMAGDVSRYTVTSRDVDDEGEEGIVQNSRVADRIVHTIHQYGLFKFHTGKNSAPPTPTASTRSRAAIFGLDAISRNLFGAIPGSKGDIFGSSIGSHRRSKSSVSRSSTYTTSDGSIMRFSQSSKSTLTNATSMSSMDENSFSGSRSSSRSRKLRKRSKSPKGSTTEVERPSSRQGSLSRAVSRDSRAPYSDIETDPDDDNDIIQQPKDEMDESEWDLTMRLELARRNSKNQHDIPPDTPTWQEPVEETIYEEEPPQPLRPQSRASRSQRSQRSTTPVSRPPSTSPFEPERRGRQTRTSQRSTDGHPRGPRTPSPLPPSPLPQVFEPRSEDLDLALEATLVNMPTPTERSESPLPRSRRQPFESTENMITTPRMARNGLPKLNMNKVQPLSIRKNSTSPTKASPTKPAEPLPVREASSVRSARTTGSVSPIPPVDTSRMTRLAESTKEDLESSRRAIKRIKMDTDQLRASLPSEEISRPQTPSRGMGIVRTPQRPAPLSRAAQERLDEMRAAISRRNGEDAARTSSFSRGFESPSAAGPSRAEVLTRLIDESASEADRSVLRAAASQDALGVELELLAADLREKSALLEKARADLHNTKRQLGLVKSLLDDATAEKEIMYDVYTQAFNAELDGMYNDANLPADEAWGALVADLRQTKTARNALQHENASLKRRIAEVESEKEDWGALLRAHGLVP